MVWNLLDEFFYNLDHLYQIPKLELLAPYKKKRKIISGSIITLKNNLLSFVNNWLSGFFF